MPLLSPRFRDTFRDIAEKALLAVALTASAVVLHFLKKWCISVDIHAWIVLLLDWVFGVLVLCDGLLIVCLAVALLIRVTVATVRELAEFLGNK